MQKVKCCYKNILESSSVTLSAGTEDSNYPLYRLYDRDIGKMFKPTAAVTIEIKVDQSATNNITPDKLIIPKGHNLFTAESAIDILVSNDNFVDESISLYRNLVRYPEQLDNAAWVKIGNPVLTANDTTAPDGQVTADKVAGLSSENALYNLMNPLIIAGQRYEPSFYIKKITTIGTLNFFHENAILNGKWEINLSAVGSGWERITRTHPAVTIIYEFTGKASFTMRPAFSASPGPIDAHIWGVQLELGEISTNYISSISHNNDLIFDIPYSPVNNLIKYSEQINNNDVWGRRGSVVITANDTTAPDGQVTADKVTGLGVEGNDFYQEIIGLTDNQRYEPSFYIKKISSSGTLRLIQAYGGYLYGDWSIDLSAVGSGWERITRSHAAVTINNEFIGHTIGGITGSGPHFIAASGTLDFHIWGVQFIEGTSPLEYQVTKDVAGYSPRRYIKIKIISPSVIPQIPELFLTQTYTFEENPDDQIDDLDDVFNVENLVTAGGQDRFLEHGDPKRQRNYTCSLKTEAQKTSILTLNNAWRGNKPFWVCDHDGTWIFSKLKDPISLKREFENEDGGIYTFNLNILEVLP